MRKAMATWPGAAAFGRVCLLGGVLAGCKCAGRLQVRRPAASFAIYLPVWTHRLGILRCGDQVLGAEGKPSAQLLAKPLPSTPAAPWQRTRTLPKLIPVRWGLAWNWRLAPLWHV